MNKLIKVAFMSFLVTCALVWFAVPSKADETTYKIVSDSTYAPFEYKDVNQKYTGIDVDIMNQVAKLENIKIDMTFPGFQSAVDAAQANQANGVMAGMSITDERKKSFDFSMPYYNTGLQLAIKKGNTKIKSLDALKGKKVAAKIGTASADWLKDNQDKYGYTIKTFDAGETMYNALNVGAIDAMMDDAPVIGYAIKQGESFEFLGARQPAGQYAFAVKKGTNQELLKKFNSGFEKLVKSGAYAKILAKYGAEDGAVSLSLEKPKPVKENYTILFDSSFAPFEFQNDQNKYVGVDVDIIDAVSKVTGFKFTKKFVGFDAAVNGVIANQADGVMSGMSITEERKKSFDFSTPYYDSSLRIAVQKDNDQIKNFKDLNAKVVGVKHGTASQTWLSEHEKEYGYTIKTFDAADSMYDSLKIKAVDAMMDDTPVLSYAIQNGMKFKMIGQAQPAGQYGFAVKKGKNPELLQAFNYGLNKIKENGTYNKILAKYMGEDDDKKSTAGMKKTVDETTFAGLIENNWKVLLEGLGKTLLLTLVSFVLAMIVGIIFGLFSVSPMKGLRLFSTFYVDIIRGVPLMVLVFFIFYGIPNLIGAPLNDFVAGTIALTLNASAYIAEIVRGGINAVPAGQMEASRSLGLGYLRTMQKIIVPQAIRIMVPSLVNQFVISLKDTTIISVIGVIELLQTSKIIVARNLQSFKVYLIVGLMYLIVITALTKLSKVLEKRVK
jgi:polar amino acid transport system substrate-binding protein